jgi:hypothetical protein
LTFLKTKITIQEESLSRHQSHYLWLSEQKSANVDDNSNITFERLPQTIRWELFQIQQKLKAWNEKTPYLYNIAPSVLFKSLSFKKFS